MPIEKGRFEGPILHTHTLFMKYQIRFALGPLCTRHDLITNVLYFSSKFSDYDLDLKPSSYLG
jgi:hypothetical protein